MLHTVVTAKGASGIPLTAISLSKWSIAANVSQATVVNNGVVAFNNIQVWRGYLNQSPGQVRLLYVLHCDHRGRDDRLPGRRRSRLRPVGIRLRRTADGRADGCRSTTGGRSLCTAGGRACPGCSAGTANAHRSFWWSGSRRSGRPGCTGGTAARRDGPGLRSGQSATRSTVRSGNTPALTSSS